MGNLFSFSLPFRGVDLLNILKIGICKKMSRCGGTKFFSRKNCPEEKRKIRVFIFGGGFGAAEKIFYGFFYFSAMEKIARAHKSGADIFGRTDAGKIFFLIFFVKPCTSVDISKKIW